ncbi:MAG: hypothetical protein JWO77_3038 [Ilumatobacteraceae bacterium]|nr:hypothetical protein [Ilumatobacteraceae bacterium]
MRIEGLTMTDRTRSRRRPGRSRLAAGLALALALGGCLLAGCGSKADDGAAAPAATTTSPDEAAATKAAMDDAEQELATIRLPGAIGVFSETIQSCVANQLPQATRTDRSSLPPDELVSQLTEQLEADGWTQDEDANGRESYSKDPYQLWVEVSVEEDGDTKAILEVAAAEANCT